MKFDVTEFEALTPVCRDKVTYFEEIGSTNTEARNAVLCNESESGNIYIAESQTKGRGRGDHQWACPAGEGLLFSLILDPDVESKYWYRMSLAVGMAIVNVTRSLGLETMIKWPNDIYFGDKKLGGILIETVNDKLVVGVGLNVNVQQFPSDLADRATSISLLLGGRIGREEVLSKLVQSIYQNGSLIGDSFSKLLGNIQSCLYTRNELVRMTVSNFPRGELIGTLIGLSENGYLLIKEMSESGIIREVEYANEIRKVEN